MSDRDGSSFVWFLAGLGVGAVVGVLYAPRSGSETRQAIFESAEQGREFVRNRAREAREQAADWADRDVKCSINRRSSSSQRMKRGGRRIIRRPRKALPLRMCSCRAAAAGLPT